MDTLSHFGQIKQLCKISRPRLDANCFLGIRELLAFYSAVFFRQLTYNLLRYIRLMESSSQKLANGHIYL